MLIRLTKARTLLQRMKKTILWKMEFHIPFVNGARNLGEALRRIEEGCSMIRTKGEPGTGNVVGSSVSY